MAFVHGGAPRLAVDVVEPGARRRRGWLACQIGENVAFTPEQLESYCFAPWDPIVYDALLVAAAIDFADRTKRRPLLAWRREIALRIPVHDPARWADKPVADALRDSLFFLTGDDWEISFCGRRQPLKPPPQGRFSLPGGLTAVIPFSNGLDSRAVAGLMALEMGDRLIRVRLGSRHYDTDRRSGYRYPFTSVPYTLRPGEKPFVESSTRSRGFKFALISGLAAFLAKAGAVIVPESGQGALGPALLTVGQAYEDYRSHPLFTDRMETFLRALLGHRVRFQFPRLWHTKAETLREFVDRSPDSSSWSRTWSCWQQSRQVSVGGKRRHCGICAACMLRRLSVHAAGLAEPRDTYVWEDLSAATFRAGAAPRFCGRKVTRKFHEYAIAGALHLDHLAAMRASPANAQTLDLATFKLSRSLGLPEAETRARLHRLLMQHEREWKSFIDSLGPSSFMANWATHAA
jgi:7-cyano-7-deazaguanine synthase in queuosine biosynthesis